MKLEDQYVILPIQEFTATVGTSPEFFRNYSLDGFEKEEVVSHAPTEWGLFDNFLSCQNDLAFAENTSSIVAQYLGSFSSFAVVLKDELSRFTGSRTTSNSSDSTLAVEKHASGVSLMVEILKAPAVLTSEIVNHSIGNFTREEIFARTYKRREPSPARYYTEMRIPYCRSESGKLARRRVRWERQLRVNSAVWYASPRVGRRVCRKERSLHSVRLRERVFQAICAATPLPRGRVVNVVDDSGCVATHARVLA